MKTKKKFLIVVEMDSEKENFNITRVNKDFERLELLGILTQCIQDITSRGATPKNIKRVNLRPTKETK